MKILFWIIVAVCVVTAFPVIGVGAVALAVLFLAAFVIALWTKCRREMKELEKAEVQRCELEAAERERLKEQAEITQKWAKIHAEKRKAEARATEEAHRDRAERIARYNRLAKEAASEGDTETAECWRRLAVEELKKYTNRSTNKF